MLETLQFIKECKVRHVQKYNIETLTDAECNMRFKITKYYTQEYICYRFELQVDTEYDYKSVATALTYSGSVVIVRSLKLTHLD